MLPFVPDADEHRGKIFFLPQKSLKTFAVIIRALRGGVGVVADETAVNIAHSGEMGTEFVFPVPAVEENTNGAVLGQPIEFCPVRYPFYREAVLLEEQGGPQNGGTGIAMDQGKLMLIIADQFLRLRPVTQQPQSIVGSDPAAAGGGAGTESVPPLLLGDFCLVIDQFVHIRHPAGGRR